MTKTNGSPSTAPASSSRQRWLLLVTVSAGLLLITLDNSILYTALPTLTAEIGASPSQGLWIINAYPLVMAGLLLGAGTLGDRVGHQRMFLIGLVIFTVASLVAAFAPNPGVLTASRAVLAVGAASMMPATLALIRIAFTVERERNIAIAVWGSIALVGSALGPIVGGALLEHFWWGSVFLVNVPVAVAALLVMLKVAPRNDPDPSKSWDLVSSVQVMVAMVGLVFALKEVTKPGPSWPVVLAALVAAAIGVTTFTRRQSRLDHPLLDFSIFRNNAFSAGVLAAVFAMFASGGIQLVTSQRYQLVEGFSPLEAGALVAAVAVGALPTGLLGGAFLHVVGLRTLIGGGLVISTAGVVVTVTTFQSGLGWMIAGLVLTGMGLGAAMSVASTAIVGNVPPRRAGMASSLEEVSYEFGSLTAVALLGSLLTAIYTSTITLPPGAPVEAGESISGALASSASEPGILDAAFTAFDHGYSVVMVVVAVVLAAGAVLTTSLLWRYGPGSASSSHDSNH
jgi:DHA2 family multidrug resistance protein-like MFS transporter